MAADDDGDVAFVIQDKFVRKTGKDVQNACTDVDFSGKELVTNCSAIL